MWLLSDNFLLLRGVPWTTPLSPMPLLFWTICTKSRKSAEISEICNYSLDFCEIPFFAGGFFRAILLLRRCRRAQTPASSSSSRGKSIRYCPSQTKGHGDGDTATQRRDRERADREREDICYACAQSTVLTRSLGSTPTHERI